MRELVALTGSDPELKVRRKLVGFFMWQSAAFYRGRKRT
jgi:hypothetical protein